MHEVMTGRRPMNSGSSDGGELHAMMLDMKRTFDEIVEAHTDADRARAILPSNMKVRGCAATVFRGRAQALGPAVPPVRPHVDLIRGHLVHRGWRTALAA
ncbi:hypothetical protein [Streptomyces pristinaespiralis]|uniref:hypothetical protein n=1 Tax=Streptomyces pristinaespiralis TaxID=38300 RepID=UPI003833DCED